MRVLLATDFSPHADDAAKIVGSLPLPSGSTIRVVHVIEPLPQVTAFAPAGISELTAAAEQHVRGELESFAAKLRAPGRTVETALVIGRTADVIVEEAERSEADLIVIGSRGRRAIKSALLGSVSAEVVDRARCPVLVARGPALRRVVLADDGSVTAAAGARLLATVPALSDLAVRVVSVVDVPFPSTLAGNDAAMATYAAIQAYYDSLPGLRDETAKIARDRAEALTASGMKATSEVREGDAAAQLIAAADADRSDCIVIGSHGRTGVTRMLLGSVARTVLFNAPCSVLIVRGTKVAGGDREKVLAAST
ncbi:MAG: universal stress protein [Chloroflexota bacterium]